jgi:hypothetical protein
MINLIADRLHDADDSGNTEHPPSAQLGTIREEAVWGAYNGNKGTPRCGANRCIGHSQKDRSVDIRLAGQHTNVVGDSESEIICSVDHNVVITNKVDRVSLRNIKSQIDLTFSSPP